MGRTEEKAPPIDRTRDSGDKVKHTKFDLNTTLFSCESGQVLEQIAHRGCGVSISDVQNLTGHSPGKLTLVDPAVSKVLD